MIGCLFTYSCLFIIYVMLVYFWPVYQQSSNRFVGARAVLQFYQENSDILWITKITLTVIEKRIFINTMHMVSSSIKRFQNNLFPVRYFFRETVVSINNKWHQHSFSRSGHLKDSDCHHTYIMHTVEPVLSSISLSGHPPFIKQSSKNYVP